ALGLTLRVVLLATPTTATAMFASLGRLIGATDPRAVPYLLISGGQATTHLLVVSLLSIGCLIVGSSRGPWAGTARGLLLAIIALDLVASNSRVNPTDDLTLFD